MRHFLNRKTAAQIRRLRESIQAKAFKMNNPPAFYEKRKNNMKTAADKKISEEERLEQENQVIYLLNVSTFSFPNNRYRNDPKKLRGSRIS